MKGKKPGQCRLPHRFSPYQQFLDEPARIKNTGHSQQIGQFPGRCCDVAPNGNGPVGKLIPRKKITTEITEQGHNQHDYTDHPVQ